MEIELSNQQSLLAIDERALISAARRIVDDAGYSAGTLSLAVVDDPTIHGLNRRFLAHDYPTDVLSFEIERGPDYLEGEVIVSADTAAANADDFGWRPHDELLLYVIHGVLHLVGYRDKTPVEAADMRTAERRYLSACGVTPPKWEAPR